MSLSKPHVWHFFLPTTVQCYLSVAAWKIHLVPLYRETTIQINIWSHNSSPILFDQFKYSYKAVLWQASQTFTDQKYQMSGISSVLVLWLYKNPTNSYLIFDAASRNKPWSNSIARSKAPSVISPEITSLKQ